MQMLPGVLALGLPSGMELMVLLVIGLLLFGKRLPEVGRTVGKTVQDFRRGLQGMKDELERDEDFRDARSAVRDLKTAVDAPRKFTNPRRMLADLAKEEPPAQGGSDTVAEHDPDAVYRQEHPESTHPAADAAEPKPSDKDQKASES